MQSLKSHSDASSWRALEAALENVETVRGTVTALVKGGYRVSIPGFDAFLPATQMQISLPSDPSVYLGEALEFNVLKLDFSRKNIVLTRIPLLKARQDQQFAMLQVGDVLDGVVENIREYGAFVSLGDASGLLHRDELFPRGKGIPAAVLAHGQKIQVKVIALDMAKKRICLGLTGELDAQKEPK
ncbi:30S ribosomal protein S1 [Burkholderia sp. Bp9125]|nr:30S ribosomal protein S1 [Burkholderia sp. Bp9125]